MFRFYMSCPAHCEELLRKEIEAAGGQEVKTRVRAVTFSGTSETGYRLALFSRIGNALYQILTEGHAVTKAEVVALAEKVSWCDLFPLTSSFSVTCKLAANNATEILNSQYGALLLKDVVCDNFRQRWGQRPSVDSQNPAVKLHLQTVHAHVMICLHWSGEGLSRRGYRVSGGKAPLKENLAAAIVARSQKSLEAADFVVDPMCGSGTLLIEAAQAYYGVAPGLIRGRQEGGFGFESLKGFDEKLWHRLWEEAEKDLREASLKPPVKFLGFDIDREAVEAARKNVEAALCDQWIEIKQIDFHRLSSVDFPKQWTASKSFVLTNPPYGHRLGEKEKIDSLYNDFGNCLKTLFAGAQAAVLCGDKALGAALGLKAKKISPFRNGPLETVLAHFQLFSKEQRQQSEKSAEVKRQQFLSGETLSEGTKMFINRLKKNQKEWKKTPHSKKTTAYRLYDADMPEYNAAIEIYTPVQGDDLSPHIYMSEYQPPSSVSSEARERRLKEMEEGLLFFFQTDLKHLHLRTRFRQKKGNNYEKIGNETTLVVIKEEELLYELNLSDYLDTGIYLDHRPLRRWLKKEAEGKRFLNLFAYTATASLCAAAGGARRVVSVDASLRYLEMGKRHFELNGLTKCDAAWVKSDVLEYLRESYEPFDLIYLDPPTFSNSKSGREDFNLQLQQGELIRLCMKRLAPKGVLYFSNHFRKFVLEEFLKKEFHIKEITDESFDPDFRKSQKAHRCWRITK